MDGWRERERERERERTHRFALSNSSNSASSLAKSSDAAVDVMVVDLLLGCTTLATPVKEMVGEEGAAVVWPWEMMVAISAKWSSIVEDVDDGTPAESLDPALCMASESKAAP